MTGPQHRERLRGVVEREDRAHRADVGDAHGDPSGVCGVRFKPGQRRESRSERDLIGAFALQRGNGHLPSEGSVHAEDVGLVLHEPVQRVEEGGTSGPGRLVGLRGGIEGEDGLNGGRVGEARHQAGNVNIGSGVGQEVCAGDQLQRALRGQGLRDQTEDDVSVDGAGGHGERLRERRAQAEAHVARAVGDLDTPDKVLHGGDGDDGAVAVDNLDRRLAVVGSTVDGDIGGAAEEERGGKTLSAMQRRRQRDERSGSQPNEQRFPQAWSRHHASLPGRAGLTGPPPPWSGLTDGSATSFVMTERY